MIEEYFFHRALGCRRLTAIWRTLFPRPKRGSSK